LFHVLGLALALQVVELSLGHGLLYAEFDEAVKAAH
jgi:hypothetical protein